MSDRDSYGHCCGCGAYCNLDQHTECAAPVSEAYRRAGQDANCTASLRAERDEARAELTRIRQWHHPDCAISLSCGDPDYTQDDCTCDMRWQEHVDLRAKRDKARKALAFAASAIKSGEPWSQTCEEVIGSVLRELGH